MSHVIGMEGTPAISRRRLSRAGFAALGVFLVGIGTIGLAVPVWPTTIFYILALWCFKRSSSRLENWLLNHRVVGSTLRDWEETRSLTRRTKVVAIAAIWAAIVVSILLVGTLWVKGLLAGVAIALTVYLWTRKTKPN